MSAEPHLQQLDRLESYLRQDSDNPHLLAEAFDAALAGAAWDRAAFHLHHARALGHDRVPWHLREAHWLLAQHEWKAARAVLLLLEHDDAVLPHQAQTIAHDLAYIDLCEGHYAAGIERLDQCIASTTHDAATPALRALWLRLMHHADRHAQALAWLLDQDRRGGLDANAAGIGSLIALDQSDYEASSRWAERALNEDPVQAEALVARASLALAEHDASLARRLLQRAMQRNGGDGRIWSALGFAELLDQNLPAARDAFSRATALLPEHIGTWHGLGWTALAQGDLVAARTAFDASLALDRNFSESHGGAAVASALAGDRDAARTQIARALGLDRASFAARYAQAVLNGDAGDLQSLLRLGERLLGDTRSPTGVDVMSLLRRARPKGH